MFKIISLVFITFLLNGCSLINSSKDSFKFKYYQSTGTTDFHQLTQELLKDLAPTILSIKNKKRDISPLYVTDFVNIENLDNSSKLGFILSDELKTNITQDINWPIYQIEYAKFLKVGTNGTKLLSRDVSDLKYKNMDDTTYALVGTYAITQRQFLIYVKLINLQNGVILKSSTQRISLTDEIINLEQKATEISPQVYTPLTI